jgi:hypothetical protein
MDIELIGYNEQYESVASTKEEAGRRREGRSRQAGRSESKDRLILLEPHRGQPRHRTMGDQARRSTQERPHLLLSLSSLLLEPEEMLPHHPLIQPLRPVFPILRPRLVRLHVARQRIPQSEPTLPLLPLLGAFFAGAVAALLIVVAFELVVEEDVGEGLVRVDEGNLGWVGRGGGGEDGVDELPVWGETGATSDEVDLSSRGGAEDGEEKREKTDKKEEGAGSL